MNSTQASPISVIIPVYNDGTRAVAAAGAMLRQTLPGGHFLEILLVDDGSTDDTSAQLIGCDDPRIRVLTLPGNTGRSAARNAGVAAALGELVIFMDCDCIPADGYLTGHFDSLSSGAVASTGNVVGEGYGFWNRYQRESSERRRRQHAAGVPYAGSSQNLAVRRSVFDTVGGFATDYRRYGFEDRDLLLRIADHGLVAWAEGATVQHHDTITLSEVSAKMAEAGEHSSQRFAAQHPEAYERLGYAAMDTRIHPGLKLLTPLCIPVASFLARAFDSMQCERWLPYALAKGTVKVTSALSYLGGTARGH